MRSALATLFLLLTAVGFIGTALYGTMSLANAAIFIPYGVVLCLVTAYELTKGEK